ncbi:hypothetical protein N7486_008102 [Penicillium sp. IBT 16267x]|nr:hypothetical protein N7486_008102 [Penicillium sp. IBT 16267x]
MKLEPFGFEISAAIDVGVERQYLECITSLDYQPRTIHAARGTQPTLLEKAHYEIRRFEDPTVEQPGECFRYGRSMDNPRIEGWCSHLSRASTGLFHRYFDDLMEEGLFLADCIPEQSWTSTWNRSPIRKQKDRPHVVTGQPIFNYFHSKARKPPVEDRKCPFDSKSEAAQTLLRDIHEWDPNEYLPPPTLFWCQTQLQEIGLELGLPVGSRFDPEDPHLQLIGDKRQPYRAVYEKLRLRALAHWRSGEEPILEVCEKPIAELGS